MLFLCRGHSVRWGQVGSGDVAEPLKEEGPSLPGRAGALAAADAAHPDSGIFLLRPSLPLRAGRLRAGALRPPPRSSSAGPRSLWPPALAGWFHAGRFP